MALALYRKYRPRTFAEVIGQEHVTEPLMQALRSGRFNHAYLFSGPRGCGKTSSARILARSLNCAKGPTPEPCGECDSCVALAPDGPGSIDVIEIDAASHGGVDDARDLRERAIFAPVASRFKVYVIDEAHMVSSAGFNALLKLVEEPPDYVKFVFATTEPEKVLGTIKSRTHHYPFRLIPPGTLRPYLEQLCEREGARVEPAVFPLVVRAGGGSARDSLSVLDQLIAGAGTEGVTYARAVALLGVTDVALIDEMIDAFAAGDGAAVFATVDRVAEAGHDPRRFATDLLGRLRDLIVLQRIPDAGGKGLLDAPDDELVRMAAQADRFGPATLSRMADLVHDGLTEMRGTTAPRLLLELICARMLLPGADDSVGALLHRLERMERRLAVTSDAAEPAPLDTNAQSADPVERAPSAGPSPARRPQPPEAGRRPQPPEAAPRADAAEPPRREPSRPPRQEPATPPRSAGYAEAQQQAPAATASRRASSATTQQQGPRTTAKQPADPAPATDPPPPTTAKQSGPSTTAKQSGPSTTAMESGPPATPTESGPPTTRVPGVLDAAAVRRVWDEILGHVGRKRRAAAAVAREATVREVDGDTLVLLFKHLVHANMLSGGPELLLEAVHEVLGPPAPNRSWQVRCEVGGQGNPGGQDPGGGTARSAPVPPAPRTATPRDDGGWPVTATLGGPAPTPSAAVVREPEPEPEPEEEPDPDDEVIDEQSARQTSEQQALHLLAQALGAEKIGELDNR